MKEILVMLKVSIVVPVYNCEKFILEFVECLNNQIMHDFETIFIDDCSDDGTSELLQKEIVSESRYSYYRNTERMGAAYSRNRGIEMSKAPYILCLDADDRFEPDLIEQVTEAAYENNADMVMLERNDFYGFDINTVKRERYLFVDEKQLLKKQPFTVKEQPIDFLLRCENGTHDRMIHKSLLDKYEIRFQNLKNSNDVFYTVFSTLAANKIVHTKEFANLYHRRVHNEPQRISYSRDPMCAYEALLKVHDHLVKYDLWDDYCVHFWVFALDSLEKQLFVCKDSARREEVYRYIQEEGLKKLGVENDREYVRLPEAYHKQFRRFFDLPYDCKCFMQSMSLEAVCEENIDNIQKLASDMEQRRVAFWGIGRKMPVFLNAYKNQGGMVSYILDNDTNKQGRIIEGIEVTAYEKVWNQIDAVIVSNRNFYLDIQEQIRKYNDRIEILCLEEIVYANDTKMDVRG